MDRELKRHFSLLAELVRKDLKVRYKRSVLGFVWSLLNPLLMMAVFTFIFVYMFQVRIPLFPVYFLTGFLPWSFFAASVSVNVASIVSNSGLVKKIRFPTEFLPLSSVLAQGIHFLLALALLYAALAVIGLRFLPFIPLVALAVVLMALLTFGVSLALAAANVFFRDVQEFVPVLLLVWFYATPIVYQVDQLPDSMKRYAFLFWLNPATPIMQLFRDGLWAMEWPSFRLLGLALFATAAVVALGWGVFRALAWRFAEEL